MGQIVGLKAKPKRCNLNALGSVPTPAAGEYILVSYDNSMTANGQGNFDRYIIGDGRTAATELELKYLDDSTHPYIVEEVNKAVADIQPIEITGDVTNAPDEEDLTSENQGGTDVLKFKDKAYNAALYSGLGRVYLRKNIVTLEGTGKNVLTQAMVNTANTIYHIQYDYDLNGQTITLPAGCVLEFDGGSVKNGTIVLTNTTIKSRGGKIFDSVTLSGSVTNDEMPISWWNVTRGAYSQDAVAYSEFISSATANTSVINGYIIPSLNVIGGTLIVDFPVYINNALSRIYGFSINCVSPIYYIGNDDYNGAIIEVGGNDKKHTIRLWNNPRRNVSVYPEYATNNSFDKTKAYAVRKDYLIVGLLIRDSYESTINIEDVRYFTTGVMVAGGYGSDNSHNFVSYERINLNNIQNCLRGIVFNYDAGWITECAVSKGRIWTSGDDPFEGHVYAITFEKTSGDWSSTSNMRFINPCVEGAYCGVYINNMRISASSFEDVRDESVTNKIVENNANISLDPAVYTSYYASSTKTTPFRTIINKNGNTSDVNMMQAMADFRTIYSEVNSNNRASTYCVRDMFVLNNDNSVTSGHVTDTNYSPITISATGAPIFHQYHLPCLLFENNGESKLDVYFEMQKSLANQPSIRVVFFDENWQPVTNGITSNVNTSTGSEPAGRFVYTYLTTGANTASTRFYFEGIPNNVKRVAIAFTSMYRCKVSLNTSQVLISAPNIYTFPQNPVNAYNDSLENLSYIDTTLQKKATKINGAWVTDDGYYAVATKGTSAQRPELANNVFSNNGFRYFDTTLLKSIYYNSSETNIIHYKGTTINGDYYWSNPLTQGLKYYVYTDNSKADDTQVLYFCKTNNSLEDAIAIPLTFHSTSGGSSHFISEVFTAPDPAVYPYLCHSVVSTGSSKKLLDFFRIDEKWLESDGATAGVARSGATASRPLASDIYVGFKYFDTDENNAYYYNGSTWARAGGDIQIVHTDTATYEAMQSHDSNTLYALDE